MRASLCISHYREMKPTKIIYFYLDKDSPYKNWVGVFKFEDEPSEVRISSGSFAPKMARNLGYYVSQAGWLAEILDRHPEKFPIEEVEFNTIGPVYQLFGDASYV